MAENNKATALQLGLYVFGMLAVLTVIEFGIASFINQGALLAMKLFFAS